MTVRVNVEPALYAWASERSRLGVEELLHKFPKLRQWESGEHTPTLKQLESFARATRTPVGYFFLPEPPVEEVPIPDFRTIGDEQVARPSPNLLDTIFECQQRQDWFREYALGLGLEPIPHVGSLTVATPVGHAASVMSEALTFSVGQRGSNWSDAFTYLRDQAEEVGILVMVSGVVGSNTHRKLDPQEFRGFALVDPIAPLVFVNGADTKAAQIFTLAHELAHIWLGETGLSDADLGSAPSIAAERWCNEVAAELLVPIEALRTEFAPAADLTAELNRLARRFKASTLVLLRRVHEAGFLAWDDYRKAYRAELARVMGLIVGAGDGGNFYNTQPVRVSKLFARSVIASTLEGQTLHTDAFRMLGFKKISTFHELSERLGIT
ncbi:ImmA/IrrE family metallo-endopeptidase [Candidatus Poriferisodalis sp.]|uniref:ImmA/IrrE family metallo-endopeptidase n=1 Tax=Candidatus Poriferisodalis sp. TaxID=3101277 RepID=UPI003B52FCD2